MVKIGIDLLTQSDSVCALSSHHSSNRKDDYSSNEATTSEHVDQRILDGGKWHIQNEIHDKKLQ
jgi:hypothetical protein